MITRLGKCYLQLKYHKKVLRKHRNKVINSITRTKLKIKYLHSSKQYDSLKLGKDQYNVDHISWPLSSFIKHG
jgi:hypothetical protein